MLAKANNIETCALFWYNEYIKYIGGSVMTIYSENDLIPFPFKGYKFKKWLTPGGTGDTLLMYDETIDQYFVCKKFAPKQLEYTDKFFANFIEEIKILYNSYHKNIVRIFCHFIYSQYRTGYIVMEYIDGVDIEAYISANPDAVNEVFIQTIEGFTHLENLNILHRDIRSSNILVSNEGIVKIIDFGFGKIINDSKDIKTTLLLNWTEGELPDEIHSEIYSIQSDIYFLGRLFEKIIAFHGINSFRYLNILEKMTCKKTSERLNSFHHIKQQINNENIYYVSENEKLIYLNLANALSESISEFNKKPEFIFDDEQIIRNLTNFITYVQWEKEIKNIKGFVECFFSKVDANYVTEYYDYYGNYESDRTVDILMINAFLTMFNNFNNEKRRNILENLFYNRINLINVKNHYSTQIADNFADLDDDGDLPF